MTSYIIIAGPQSSGKSSLLKYLKTKYPKHIFIEEKNPASVTGKKDFGAINSGSELEKKIIEEDIKHIQEIDRKNKIIIIESDIFHCVYADYFNGKKNANKYYRRYLKAHQGFNPVIIFINTLPEISWKRRRYKYVNRIRNKKIKSKKEIKKLLDRYQEIILQLYPIWIKYYKKVPFKKLMIENSYKSKNEFINEVDKIILSLLENSH